MKTGKIIALAGIGYALFQVGKEKYDDFAVGFQDSLDQLKYDIKGISNIKLKNVTFSTGTPKVTFDMDLKISNPSELDFTANGGKVINLKKIDVLTLNNDLLATITPGISQIELPPNGSTRLNNLPVEIPVSKLGNLVDMFLTGLNVDEDQFALRLNVVVAGTQFVINTKE